MSTIEVLVATMHQKDFSLYKDMNIQCDAVFANQDYQNNLIESKIDGHKVIMITTNQRGVGKNRNNALEYACADICLLSDQDMFYFEGYHKIVERAFNEIPLADMIIFNIDTIGTQIRRRRNNRIKKIHFYNALNYGAVRIAFKRERILQKNIWFSILFGGGCIYSHGEDSIFIREALRKKLRIYVYPETIGCVKQIESSWFSGYNEKFFFDKGALVKMLFPAIKYLIGLIYFPIRYRRMTNLTFIKIAKCIINGIKAYDKGIDYKTYQSKC